MSTPSNNNQSNTFRKWLLGAVLLLSFFSFSAPVAQSPVKQEIRQTVLVVNSSSRPVKCINFNGAFQKTSGPDKTASFFTQPFVNLIYLHTRHINNRLKNHSGPGLYRMPAFLFGHVKTIPQNPDDAPCITLATV